MTQPQQDSARSPSFEEAMAELESIVRELEGGEASLEAALSRYEAGVSLLKGCYAQLRQAEQRVLLLAGEDSEGKPVTHPFEHPTVPDPHRPDPRRRPSRGESSY